EPAALTAMTLECFTLSILHVCRVDECLWNHRAPKAVAEPVRHGMIDRDARRNVVARWYRAIPGHAARERGRDRKTRRVHVVFHVVLRRVSQDNGRLDLANDRSEAPQRVIVVEH